MTDTSNQEPASGTTDEICTCTVTGGPPEGERWIRNADCPIPWHRSAPEQPASPAGGLRIVVEHLTERTSDVEFWLGDDLAAMRIPRRFAERLTQEHAELATLRATVEKLRAEVARYRMQGIEFEEAIATDEAELEADLRAAAARAEVLEANLAIAQLDKQRWQDYMNEAVEQRQAAESRVEALEERAALADDLAYRLHGDKLRYALAGVSPAIVAWLDRYDALAPAPEQDNSL